MKNILLSNGEVFVSVQHSLTQTRQVRDVFNLADKNGDNALDMDEIMKLLKTLNADIKRKYVQEMFEVSSSLLFILIMEFSKILNTDI